MEIAHRMLRDMLRYGGVRLFKTPLAESTHARFSNAKMVGLPNTTDSNIAKYYSQR